MTKGEKIQILDNSINLTYKLLEKAYKEGRDVNEIKTTVDILSYLECYADSLKSRPGEQECEKEFSIAEAVNPVPEPEIFTPAPAPSKATMSKEEIRDKLSTYSNKYDFLDVAAIMSEMGYSKLSDIPAERYGELIEHVEAHIKEGA